jgi:hypothetical protein
MEDSLDTSLLSFLPNFSEEKYDEIKNLYLNNGSAKERRAKLYECCEDPSIPEGNTLRDFIFDQFLLSIEFSLQKKFTFATVLALLQLLNEEFDNLLNANPDEIQYISRKESSEKLLSSIKAKVRSEFSFLILQSNQFLCVDRTFW